MRSLMTHRTLRLLRPSLFSLASAAMVASAYALAQQPDLVPSNAPPALAADDAVAQAKVAKTKADDERRDRMSGTQTVLRAVALAELQFIRNACDPKKDQITSIAHDLGLQLRQLAPEFVDQAGAGPDVFPLTRANVKRLDEAITVILKKRLSAPQMVMLRAETQARVKHRSKTVISHTLVQLDTKLLLSQAQRRRIRQSLASNWPSAHDCTARLVTGDSRRPNIPEKCVTEFLTDSQKSIWIRWESCTDSKFEDLAFPLVAAEFEPMLAGTRVDDERELDVVLAAFPAPTSVDARPRP